MSQRGKEKIKQERRQVYEEIVEAFEQKYHWLGRQAAREMLLSAASYNIQKYSNPPMRYRTHLMFAWERGWFKSTLMRKMADILGEEMCSVIGKVSDAAMRGSVSGNSFTPPKPLRTPIVMSTEFGQTNFQEEMLNLFLNLLEEGHGNVALNKIANIGDKQRRSIENEYDNQIEFKENNEFDLKTNFVFWGATYDPTKLADDALRSRFNVVTPVKPLDYKITQNADYSKGVMKQIDNTTVRDVRQLLNAKVEFPTDFRPQGNLYEKHNLHPRFSRDVQAYMACRNWWGLNVNPEIMGDYMEYLKRSRRVATMTPREHVFDLIFDQPRTYDEIKRNTGLERKEIYKILEYDLNATKFNMSNEDPVKWVIWSGDGKEHLKDDENI